MNNDTAVVTDNDLNRFLTVGKLEGYSFLVLLFIAMPLKYLAGFPVAVRIAGSVHGILFIAFMITIFTAVKKERLSTESATYAFLLSLIPFGTFFLNKLVKE